MDVFLALSDSGSVANDTTVISSAAPPNHLEINIWEML